MQLLQGHLEAAALALAANDVQSGQQNIASAMQAAQRLEILGLETSQASDLARVAAAHEMQQAASSRVEQAVQKAAAAEHVAQSGVKLAWQEAMTERDAPGIRSNGGTEGGCNLCLRGI